MTVVTDFIAAELAKLVKIVPTPVVPFGYGTDLSCVSDVTETMDEVDPFSVRGIGEALVRQLTTPRGSLPDDPDYGLDVRRFLNRGMTRDEITSLSGQIATEVGKDDRVSSSAVTVALPDASTLRIALAVTPQDPLLGNFKLVFAVTSGDLVIEELG
jgi:hypothetical protein